MSKLLCLLFLLCSCSGFHNELISKSVIPGASVLEATHSITQGKFCNPQNTFTEYICGSAQNQNEGWVSQPQNCWHRLTAEVCNVSAWVPPIGVPVPVFGLLEKAENSAQTFFICPGCGNATDSANSFGSPSLPRRSLPVAIAGGSTINLMGSINQNLRINGEGTASAPIFIRSFDPAHPAQITARQKIIGRYIIIENLWFGPENPEDTDFGLEINEGTHFISVRNNVFRGNLNRSGGIGLGSWNYGGSDNLSDIVIDHNDIQNIGDVKAISDQDAHCIGVTGSSQRVWITYNTLAYCSGDGAQIEAQLGRGEFVNHIYVGKNLLHHNRQTGAWSKNATHVVFSENTAHDFRSNSGGPGACFGHQYGANYVWYLYNEAYNCNMGINIGGTDEHSEVTFLIGNYVHDLSSEEPEALYRAGAINIRGTHTAYVLDNRIINTGLGLVFINDSGLQQVYLNQANQQPYNKGVNITISENAKAYVQNIFFNLYGIAINR